MISDETIREVAEGSPVYYKLFVGYDNLITVVCMQWFDEYDYDEIRFVRNSNGWVHQFDSEEKAIEKLNEWYEQDQIDPEYRRKDLNQLVVRG